MSGRRLLIYDRTCTGAAYRPGLSHSWVAGWWVYRALRRLDGCLGVDNWGQALQWLAGQSEAIREIQYWGHGKWGELFVDKDRLDIEDLGVQGPHAAQLDAIRERLTSDALIWFRTCETFGAQRGQNFARAFAQRMDCRVAGHTFIIGPWQSGLHSLRPGQEIHWPADEGLAEGTPEDPIRAHWSSRRAPNTIHCLQGRVPLGY